MPKPPDLRSLLRKNCHSFGWLVVALLVSSFSLTLNLTSSLRLDEAQTIWVITKSIPGILAYVAKDVHVPLYFILLHIWSQVFGISVTGSRIFSLLFFIASVPGVYLLAKSLSSSSLARITTALYCLSPFITWFSTESRMYTLMLFASAWSSYAYIKVLESRARSGRLLYILVTTLGLYSHYFFSLVVALQALHFLIVLWQDRPKGQPYWKPVLRFFSCLLVMGLFFLPWLLYVYVEGSASQSRPLLSVPSSYSLLLLFVQFFTGFQQPTTENVLVSLWPLAIIMIFLTFTRHKRIRYHYTLYPLMITIGSTVIVLLVTYTVRPIFVPRYLIFTTPTLFYLIALLLKQLHRGIYLLALGMIAASSFYFQLEQRLSPEIKEREDYADAVAYVQNSVTSNDIIAATAPFTVYPIEYYYHGSARIDTIPPWNRYETGGIPPYSETALEQQVGEYRSKYQRLFVIASYDQGYEQPLLLYLDTHLERLAQTTFSPGLQVRAYKLRYD